jgi:D-3-phosphoglycerate dehydrogenase
MSLKKILVLDVIQPMAKDLLRKHMEVTEIESISTEGLAEIVPQFNAMISRNRPKMPDHVVDLAVNMEVIGVASSGTDFLNVEYAASKGIKVFSCPGGNADSVAEMALAYMVYLTHEAHKGCLDVKSGIWDRSRYESHQLIGKTVGLIGTGNIGRKMAVYLKALGCPTLFYDPYVSAEAAAGLPAKKVEFLDELLRGSDVVSIHVPLTPSTRNMIAAPQFELMKNGSCIVNMSRGGIINEADLLAALKSGKLKGAASDVMENEPCLASPLYELDNFIVAPHFAGVTVEARQIVDLTAARRILKEFGLPQE